VVAPEIDVVVQAWAWFLDGWWRDIGWVMGVQIGMFGAIWVCCCCVTVECCVAIIGLLLVGVYDCLVICHSCEMCWLVMVVEDVAVL